MPVTNQQIAELIGQAIEMMERVIEQWTVSNMAEHSDFRRALTEISETLVLMRERQEQQAKSWQMLIKILVVPALSGVVVAVLALVFK